MSYAGPVQLYDGTDKMAAESDDPHSETGRVLPGFRSPRRGDMESNSALEDCDEEKLLSYFSKMQEINPENVVTLTKLKNMKYLCKYVHVKKKKILCILFN